MLQGSRLICFSAFLIIGSVTVFSVAANYLAIKPLKFSAPNALPIQAQASFNISLSLYKVFLTNKLCPRLWLQQNFYL